MVLKVNDLPDIFRKKRTTGKEKYYIHLETSNPDFIKMYKILDTLGIENNKFFLALYDKDLRNVDPYDSELDRETKTKVLNECIGNFWYFIREVVRIPVAGGKVGTGKKYKINRGTLALNYCVVNNINSFTELPRQSGKSIAVDVILTWLYNFGTTNSQMMVINKSFKDAKDNIGRIIEIRDILPDYLRFDYGLNDEGKRLKGRKNKEFIKNDRTKCELVAKASATSPESADNLGRGCTQPFQWFDEFGFLKYNDIIFKASAPACSQASLEAKSFNKPYAKVITTTPGDLLTQTGASAFAFRNKCCKFREEFYNWSIKDLKKYLKSNSENKFFHISFSYKQIGRSQKWFDEQVIGLGNDYAKIKREILLEWNNATTNSPFNEQQLTNLDNLTREPIDTLRINTNYIIDVFEPLQIEYMYMICLDTASSSGGKTDGSAITIVDSRTKRIVATFWNNVIDTTNLTNVIYTLATQVIPNSVIIIERNYLGQAIIDNIKNTDIKHKLYCENATRTTSERRTDGFIVESKSETINYGVYTDKSSRPLMMEKLLYIVDKFPIRVSVSSLVEQLKGLEYSKAGRIDHCSGGHDDLVMSYLIGMYIYYFGKNVSQFGLVRFPDIEAATEEEEEKKYKEYLKEQEIVKLRQQNMISNLNNKAREKDELDEFVEELNKPVKYLDEVYNQDQEQQSSDSTINQISSLYQNSYRGEDGMYKFKEDMFGDIL